MTLPTSINYISQYEAVLPPRVQWDVDNCWAASVLTAMELRGVILGQPVKQLSQMFLTWLGHANYGSPPPYIPSMGGSAIAAAQQAQQIGVCREYLWPISIIGSNDYNQMVTAVNTAPPLACYQDAPNHMLTDWALFPSYGNDQAMMIANIQSNIAAGYPITCIDVLAYSHEYCIAGYDMIAGGVFCLDSHAWPQETFMPWNRLAPHVIVRNVQFTVPQQVTITAAQIQSLQQLAAQFPTIVGSA
jgi:hypothetical protein